MTKDWVYCPGCENPITVNKDGRIRTHGSCSGSAQLATDVKNTVEAGVAVATSKTRYSVDNRGTDEVPFGFVYFKDTRVGFAQGEGVFETHGWQSTRLEREVVHAHLDTVMPGWNEVDHEES